MSASDEYQFLSGECSLVDDTTVLSCLVNEERNGVGRAIGTYLGLTFSDVQILQTLLPKSTLVL